MGRPKKELTLKEDDTVQYVNVPIKKDTLKALDLKKPSNIARCRYIETLIEKDVKSKK